MTVCRVHESLAPSICKVLQLECTYFFDLSWGLSVLGKNPLYIQWALLVCVMPWKEKRKEKAFVSVILFGDWRYLDISWRTDSCGLIHNYPTVFFVSTFVLLLLFKHLVVFCSPLTYVGLMYHHSLNSLLTLSE